MTDKKIDIREQITNNIIELMEKNTGEWLAPFAGLASMPTNPQTEKSYSGMNAFYLALQKQPTSCDHKPSPEKMTTALHRPMTKAIPRPSPCTKVIRCSAPHK